MAIIAIGKMSTNQSFARLKRVAGRWIPRNKTIKTFSLLYIPYLRRGIQELSAYTEIM